MTLNQMSSTNPFLKDFLEMRKGIAPLKQSPAGPSPADVLPKTKNGRKPKAKHTKEQTTERPGLMTIIEDKPHKRVVIEYMQYRANDLTVEKMS
jgi:hypothetical protein